MNDVVVIDRNAFKVLMMAVRSYLRVPNDERKQHLLMAWDRVDGSAAQPQATPHNRASGPVVPLSIGCPCVGCQPEVVKCRKCVADHQRT